MSFSPALHHCCNSTEQLALLAEKHTNKSTGIVQEIKHWGRHLHFWKVSRRKHLPSQNFSKWLSLLGTYSLFRDTEVREKARCLTTSTFFFFFWTLKQLVTLFFLVLCRVRRTPTPAVHPIQMYLWKKTGKQCGERQSDRPRHSWKKQR